MCPLDECIMEYLSDERWGSPSPIQRETAMLASPRRVFERLEIPGEAGLVARLYEDGIIFEPAGEGQRYLYEELDAAKHLQRPDP
ncbi:winged helix-turn-helix domain-containing protein [Halobacteriales archaeon QS_8_69_73]|nr:MAG: winged helix-turn-helix domain-containing protein [Halobacteriales archaeon QS_8_69_73]